MLVTGASGFAGSLLVPRLLADGHVVRALGRDPARVSAALERGHSPDSDREATILQGDAVSGEGLARALEGVEVAYYLIHSMERPRAQPVSGEQSFAERERVAAQTFAAAAARAGVGRIVYLGGLTGQAGRPASRHLASRREVETILLEAVPASVALRASIVIGARSRSFRFLVHLVERMPVLTLPAWRNFRTQPIDGRDIIEMLAAAAVGEAAAGSHARRGRARRAELRRDDRPHRRGDARASSLARPRRERDPAHGAPGRRHRGRGPGVGDTADGGPRG